MTHLKSDCLVPSGRGLYSHAVGKKRIAENGTAVTCDGGVDQLL